jgi:hypothetical protein
MVFTKSYSLTHSIDLDELAKWCYTGVKLVLGEVTANRVKGNVLGLKK